MDKAAWLIRPVVERGETDIPLTDILINGRLDLYQDVISSGYFNVSLKGDKVFIIAGNHVGVIPLNDRIALLVEPRTGRDNWIHIIGKARGNLRALNFIARYSKLDTTSKSLLEFLANAFLRQLEVIETEGLYRQYVPKEEKTEFPHGRILLEKSVQSVWARGYRDSAAFRYYLFSPDTPHNRLLKYALYLAINILSPIPETNSRIRRQMTDYENLFASVPHDMGIGYLHYVLQSIKDHAIPETRQYYEDLCSTAILIIEQAGLIPREHGSAKTLTFAVNMEKVFQNYCYYVLQENRPLFEGKTLIHQEPAGRIPLFSGGGSDKSTATPDIVIEHPSGLRLPLEVKYKDNPGRVDQNQAITYAVAYKANSVILLCFASEAYPLGWQYLGKAGDQIGVWVYRINLESRDIEGEERQLAKEISTKLQEAFSQK